MPVSFSCSSPAPAFLYDRPRQFLKMLAETPASLVISCWYALPLFHLDVGLTFVANSLCCRYNNYRLSILICTCSFLAFLFCTFYSAKARYLLFRRDAPSAPLSTSLPLTGSASQELTGHNPNCYFNGFATWFLVGCVENQGRHFFRHEIGDLPALGIGSVPELLFMASFISHVCIQIIVNKDSYTACESICKGNTIIYPGTGKLRISNTSALYKKQIILSI